MSVWKLKIKKVCTYLETLYSNGATLKQPMQTLTDILPLHSLHCRTNRPSAITAVTLLGIPMLDVVLSSYKELCILRNWNVNEQTTREDSR